MMKKAAALLLCLCLLGLGPLPALAEAAPAGAVEITDRAGLEAIADDPAGHYALAADIDMGAAPWTPIPFSGTLEGGGHTLYNLSITEFDPTSAPSWDGNAVEYDTLYTGLFSRAQNAIIRDVHLLGVDVRVDTDQSSFASALVGYGENVEITGCSVSGRVRLDTRGAMSGVAAVVGFGWGRVTGCKTDVELVFVDGDQGYMGEQFMGAVMATGYVDIEGCDVRMRGWASVYGYVHNGGVAGMYFVHTGDAAHRGYVNNNTVDAEIYFFEANPDRRAYCSPVVGEQLNWAMTIEGNTTTNFVNGETTDYSTTLLPESCAQPSYTPAMTAPACDSFGYTTHSCATCGYSYRDSYTAPAHQPGEWEPGEGDLLVKHCTLCGALIDQAVAQTYTGIILETTSLRLAPGETVQLIARTEPTGGEDGLQFSSSDEAVATVDVSGFVTARGAGRATITCATADGALTASCAVQVGGGLPLWLLIVIIAAVAIVILVIVLALIARHNRRKRAARRAARRNVYRR